VRFTAKGDALYAFLMGWPEIEAAIAELGLGGKSGVGKVRNVELLGHKERLKFTQDAAGLKVEMPAEKPCEYAITLKIAGA
jgi:alpha-L-fucosidase